jgi:hypothetical protein
MYVKKVPETDEGKIRALQAAVDREEINGNQASILSVQEIDDLRLFMKSYESAQFVYKQTTKDLAKAQKEYSELFKNAQMYVSHFIQVLRLSVIRNEIKPEALSNYGFESVKESELPDLSTKESVIYWGEKVIQGETKRISCGGYPLYNPAIAKVKVHYEFFWILFTVPKYTGKMCRVIAFPCMKCRTKRPVSFGTFGRRWKKNTSICRLRDYRKFISTTRLATITRKSCFDVFY